MRIAMKWGYDFYIESQKSNYCFTILKLNFSLFTLVFNK